MKHIHSRQHQSDRSAYFDLHPLCERCIKKGITIESFILHHIDRNQENRSFDNFEALCNDCHEIEHNRKTLCGCDIDGMPTNNEHWWSR
jgi:5-methylcytosine-specific restriction endonuclease McrA